MRSETARESVTVEVDTSTVEMLAHGSITGVVFIRCGSATFPSRGWTDFPVVIFEWWLEPVLRILQGKTRQWECRFMDGPCLARLIQEQDDTWSLTGLHHDRAEFQVLVSCAQFLRSVLRAASTLLAECEKNGWQTRDIDHLASTVRSLQTPLQ